MDECTVRISILRGFVTFGCLAEKAAGCCYRCCWIPQYSACGAYFLVVRGVEQTSWKGLDPKMPLICKKRIHGYSEYVHMVYIFCSDNSQSRIYGRRLIPPTYGTNRATLSGLKFYSN